MVLSATRPPRTVDRPVSMTFEEFLDWSPDEGQSEWVDGWGTIYMSDSPRHEQVLQFMNFLLQGVIRSRDLGEVFTSTTLMHLASRPAGRMPDLFVVLTATMVRLQRRWFEGPADFVIEVLSDSSLHRDLDEKLHEYEAAGVPEYLVADGRVGKSLFRWHQLGDDGRFRLIEPDADGRYHPRIIPGFWFDPRWLTQNPLPDIFALLRQMAPDAFAAPAS